MTRLAFVVPGPVVPWQRAQGSGKRRYTSDEQRAYQRHVAWCAKAARPSDWPLDAEYAIGIHVTFPDRRRRDMSNVLKTIEDGAIGVLWDDDSQIAKFLPSSRNYSKASPGVTVIVEVVA